MRAIICDRCGAVQSEGLGVTVTFPFATLGKPDEINLCRDCGKELRLWVKGEADHEHHPAGNT